MVEVTRNTRDELVAITSLQEFFRDSVDAAMATNKVVLDEHTAHYVVNLLTLYSRSEELYEQTPDGMRLRPLASMFVDAVEAPSYVAREHNLQRIGDVALFISGFFASGLERAAVDIDYYVHMGGAAYYSLSANMHATLRGRALNAVFAELAAKFQDMVDVLNEVRESACESTDENLMRTYDLWIKTGSQRAARLLRGAGVYPMPGARVNYKH